MSTVLLVALGALLAALVAWALARWRFAGPDLSAFDAPTGEHFAGGTEPSDEHRAVVASLGDIQARLRGRSPRRRLALLREHLDTALPIAAPNVHIEPARAGGVPGEWVRAPGADPARRLLYLHGGAFIVGSARSHRRLTVRLAQLTGASVLAIDYRLMPEHRRTDAIDDCRAAYRWLLDHGPDGAAPAASLWIAGDSAGGNLALSLIAWVRDQGLRQADAVVAFSPATDASLGSPSLRAHVATDPMLGPLYGRLARLPGWVLLWLGFLQMRVAPRDPRVSPLLGDLSRLPPVLVQASQAEMLRDDARRYVNRARAAGSPARLQTWDHMVHAWPIYHPDLAEGRAALDEAARFLLAHRPPPR